jgi:NADH dehydrogenase FAD-containing subunit
MSNRANIIIIGGGFGGLESILYLHHRLGDRVDLTLISDRCDFVFRPYLSYVPFGLWTDRLKIDLIEFAGHHNVRFIQDRVDLIDTDRRQVRIGELRLDYDALILATGARRGPEAIPGILKHAYTPWRESDSLLLKNAFNRLIESIMGEGRKQVVFLVPPQSLWAGPLYEMAFMLEQWFQWKQVRTEVDLYFLTSEPSYMAVLGEKIHPAIEQAFKIRGIQANAGVQVEQVEEKQIIKTDGTSIPFDLLIVSPSYAGTGQWEGLPVDEHGFLKTVTATRQVQGFDRIYAVGDVSDFPIKQAYIALLQADAASEYISSLILEEEPEFDFEPMSVWMMEQFDQALIAQVPFEDHQHSGEGGSTEKDFRLETLPVGALRRLHIRRHLPWRFDTNNPLYAGLLWKGTEMGLKVLPYLEKGDEE